MLSSLVEIIRVIKPSTHWWQETLSCADDKTRNLSHVFTIQWVLMTRILSWRQVLCLSRYPSKCKDGTRTRQRVLDTVRMHYTVYFDWQVRNLAQDKPRQGKETFFDILIPRLGISKFLSFVSIFSSLVLGLFSHYTSFFIGNFIFHLSLELLSLRKVGKTRLKVVYQLLMFLAVFCTKSKKRATFKDLRLGSYLLSSCLIFGQNPRLKLSNWVA